MLPSPFLATLLLCVLQGTGILANQHCLTYLPAFMAYQRVNKLNCSPIIGKVISEFTCSILSRPEHQTNEVTQFCLVLLLIFMPFCLSAYLS